MRTRNSSRHTLAWTVAFASAFVGPAAFAQTAVSALVEGDLLITEVMITPNGDNAKNEWFEVYNNTSSSVDLNGLVINGKSSTETQTISSSVVVAAGDYALLAVKSTNNGGIGTPDYVYTRSLNRFDGGDSVSIAYGSLTFDSLTWTATGAFKPTTGYSLQLDPRRLDSLENDDAENWCVGETEYGTGGFGTPGTGNDQCDLPILSVGELTAGDLVITEVMINPSTSDDARREYFEIYNNSGMEVNLNGLVLSDKDTDSYTIASDYYMIDGDLFLLVAKDVAATNGGLPAADVVYTRSVFRFDNGDEIYLGNGTSYVDQVSWTSGVIPAEGYSWSLDPDLWDATSNNSSASWCASTSTYGTGDRGTPQADNDACP